jgi:hypothetical protein
METALERHTRTLYDRLVSLGKYDAEFECEVVETRLTLLHRELNIPATYYAKIRAILFDGIDPCVVMLERGAVGNPSVVALRHPPSEEIFTSEGLTSVRARGTVSSEAQRIQKLEAWRDSLSPADENRLNVVEALRNHESRLVKLEERVANQEGETNGKTAQDRNNH